jgi:hypothetical protein
VSLSKEAHRNKVHTQDVIYAWELFDKYICLATTGLDPCSHDITHIKVYHNNVNSPPQGILKMLKPPDEKQDIE